MICIGGLAGDSGGGIAEVLSGAPGHHDLRSKVAAAHGIQLMISASYK